MLYLHSLSEAAEVFKALSTPMRLRIMELIYTNDDMSMNDLAEKLALTNGAVSMHVSKLEAVGLVSTRVTSGRHGVMKIVKPVYERLLVNMAPQLSGEEQLCYEDTIAIGHYTHVEAHPTCGLATADNIIGALDDPRTFAYPERFAAGILWFAYGKISYALPNRLKAGQSLKELQISFEIASECPEVNDDYPSDIYFAINDIPLGKWISPGDFGGRHGMLSPAWWPDPLNQYGLLKTLIIGKEGTFIDGTDKISDTTIDALGLDYNSSISLSFSVPKDTANCGGMTLFGSSFGDHNIDIKMKAYYKE